MDFVSLRSYLEGANQPRRGEGQEDACSTTLSHGSTYDGTEPSRPPRRTDDLGVRFAETLDLEAALAEIAELQTVEDIEAIPANESNIHLVSTRTEDSDAWTARSKTKGKEQRPKVKHMRWCGHGKLWTAVALASTIIGCLTATAARMSTDFVGLKTPLLLSPLYEPIHSVGMIQIRICKNETMTGQTGCNMIRLSPDEVGDPVFNVSRSLLTMAAGLGVALSLVLTTAMCWESINLRPIGLGFLVVYFFQSFSLLFFHSDLCHEYNCSMGNGSILCIVASLMWVTSCVSVAKMDSHKIKKMRERRRLARRQARQERRAEKEKVKRMLYQSQHTMSTEVMSTSLDSEAQGTLTSEESL